MSDHDFVNALRGALGLQPLYGPRHGASYTEACGTYLSRELICRSADPDCKRCGGSGYYDEWVNDKRCPCTGLPQRNPGDRQYRNHNPSFNSPRVT